MPKSIKKLALLLVKIFVVSVILYFLIHTVLVNWEAVRSYKWTFDPFLFTVSCLLFFLSYTFLPWIWRKLLHYMGYNVSFGQAWDMFYIGNLGHYIPGKVWTIAGMAYMAEKSGIPARIAATGAVLAQAYSLLASFVFFIIFFIFKNTHLAHFGLKWIFPVIVIMTVVFIFPNNMMLVIDYVLKKIGRTPVQIEISLSSALKTAAYYFVSWILFGCAFWFFVSAVVGWGHVNVFYAVSSYAIAYMIGFLAFFTPGGIGVREGILVWLLLDILPSGVGILIAGISRIIGTSIEILCVLSVFIRKGIMHGKKRAAE